jgi:hypothetical protein
MTPSAFSAPSSSWVELAMQIAAVRFGSSWRLVHAKGAAGRFGDPAEALAAARRLAAAAAAKGEDVELLVQRFDAELVHLGHVSGELKPRLGAAAE